MIFRKKLDVKQLKRYYFDEIRKRDKEIAELKQRLGAALKSALKQGREKAEIQSYARKLLDINKELNEELKKRKVLK